MPRFKMSELVAISILAIALATCRPISTESDTKGTLLEQSTNSEGTTKYRYLFNQTYEDEEKTGDGIMTQCFWSYETELHVDKFKNDNLGRFCSLDTGKDSVRNINQFQVEVGNFFSAVYALDKKKESQFWDDNQKGWAERQTSCTALRWTLTGLGAVAGAVTGFAGSSWTVVGIPIAVPQGTILGMGMGAGLAEAACDYISAESLQEYDTVASNVTLGGREASMLVRKVRDEIAAGRKSKERSDLFSNDMSVQPTRVGDGNLSNRKQDDGLLMVTEFLIEAAKTIDRELEKSVSLANKSMEKIGQTDIDATTLKKFSTKYNLMVDCKLGKTKCRPLACPRASETSTCKSYYKTKGKKVSR
jgi:hypothetical protein